MRFLVVFILTLVASTSLVAAYVHPYFDDFSWRTSFGQENEPPPLIEVSSHSELRALPADTKAITFSGLPNEEVNELMVREELEELHLTKAYLPEYVTALAEMPGLKRIEITINGPYSKDDLAGLAQLKPAGYLYIAINENAGGKSEVISALPRIDAPLRLLLNSAAASGELGGEEFAALGAQTRLEWLHLISYKVSDDAVAAMAAFPALKFLFARSCRGIDSDFCTALSASKSLEAFGGDIEAVDIKGILALAKLKTLKHLMLDSTLDLLVIKEFAAALKKFKLESLVFKDSRIATDVVVSQIASMKSLKYLQLNLAPELTLKAFVKLKALKKLVWLCVWSKQKRDAEWFTIFKSMKSLRRFYWSVTESLDPAQFKKLPKSLNDLTINCQGLTDDYLLALGHLENLELLSMPWSNKYTLGGVLTLAGLPALKSLKLAWTREQRAEFTKKRPDVELLPK